ncbi:MAG: hypothetical protein WC708_19780 [Lentisphaeria bacterium]
MITLAAMSAEFITAAAIVVFGLASSTSLTEPVVHRTGLLGGSPQKEHRS